MRAKFSDPAPNSPPTERRQAAMQYARGWYWLWLIVGLPVRR